MNKINWYNNKIALNVLANDLENAKNIYEAAEKHVVVGILSKNFETIAQAKSEMKIWADALDNNISIGLGAGDPKQSYMVASLAKMLKPNHANQVFTGVGLTRDDFKNDDIFINCLVSPSGKIGYVKINTGPNSSKAEDAVVPINTAIQMIKDMGGNSIKFFNMKGLQYLDEFCEVAKVCAKNNFALEPTGGITLENFEVILKSALEAGVQKIIPHVYSSIIDPVTGETKVEDVKTLLNIIKKY
ncbi:uncharacterized protein (TIGR03581 family) [Entomoplasma freundtii]|uniref:2-dehydro-3-deoxyphosphooctonate aldolase n=1 Tax=Entomoplasma freundtii TaxID=74700 RepID=A0A2K8NQL1_9MOLU|nr:KDGP aldolase [Entomoplasma freundtii]ATZ16109.1 2-dehydro-3-deoxyphosphooctonate aldolase [Entomoplasma freundtii]TDY56990.1 uncharacterized protein (TIGR03581 family) [Entomoplasma freundtii]